MRRGTLALVLFLVGIARDARAQQVDADALTKEGLSLRRQRRDADALTTFLRAYALQPSARVLAQVALAEQALGRWVDAETHLRSALTAADDPWIESHRQVLGVGLADIQTHLGWLEVDADVPGAEVWVNGARIGAVPLSRALRVESGSVLIELRATGYASALRRTSVDAGETAHESVHLVPIEVSQPGPASSVSAASGAELAHSTPSPPETQTHAVATKRALRLASLASFGAGAVGIVAGSYFGIRTFETKAQRDQVCPHPQCPSPWGVTLDDETRLLASQSTAWFAFGLLAVGAGAGLFWMSRGATAPDHAMTLHTGLNVTSRTGSAVFGGAW